MAADADIQPPSSMEFTDDQLEIFHEVIAEFAKIDWSRHNIRLAAMLARTMKMAEEAQDDLITEGFTTTTTNGGERSHPLVTVLQNLSGQIMNLRRTLALHATAGSSKADTGRQRAIRKGQEDNSPFNNDDDGLISRPAGHA